MITILVGLFLLSCVIAFTILYQVYKKKYGSLLSQKVYVDTASSPGQVLYSNTIPLMGKPDYLIKNGGMILPVELKTGKTPSAPFENHIMQLMAYCYLVEENYGIRPKGGVIKYPEKEFKVVYTDEAREGVKEIVSEIQQTKESSQ